MNFTTVVVAAVVLILCSASPHDVVLRQQHGGGGGRSSVTDPTRYPAAAASTRTTNPTTAAGQHVGANNDQVPRLLLSRTNAVPQTSPQLRFKILQNDLLVVDVFLGGSCGNTVWRTEEAIPYLEKHNITFYNPQRDDWKPSLVQEERVAKKNARVSLFFLDPNNANEASITEVAYLVATTPHRLVIAFVEPMKWCSNDQRTDRLHVLELMNVLCKRHGVQIHNTLKDALSRIPSLLSSTLRKVASSATPHAVKDENRVFSATFLHLLAIAEQNSTEQIFYIIEAGQSLLSNIVQASYLVGRFGARVTLCAPKDVIEPELINADHRRAYAYLTDVAKKNQILTKFC